MGVEDGIIMQHGSRQEKLREVELRSRPTFTACVTILVIVKFLCCILQVKEQPGTMQYNYCVLCAPKRSITPNLIHAEAAMDPHAS